MHHQAPHDDEISGKAYDPRLLGRFMAYLRPYWLHITGTLLLLPLLTVAKLAQPYLIKVAVDDHITAGKIEGLPLLALLFLLLVVGESVLSFFQIYLLQFVGQRVMYDLRLKLFARLQSVSASFFDRTPVGSVVTRVTSDVEVLGEMFAAGVITIVGDVMVLAGIVGIMLWMNVKLSLVAFSVLPLLFAVVFTFRRRMRVAFRGVRAKLSSLNSFLAESIGGMTVIQLFNRQDDEKKIFTRLNAEYRDSNYPVISWDASLYALVEALSSVAAGFIIWYGGGEIVRSNLSFGELVAFIQYSERFFTPIRDLSAKYSVMQGAMAALERIFILLDTEQAESQYAVEKTGFALKKEGEGIFPDPGPLQNIEFRNVGFGYREGEPVLKDFSLDIRRGEKIALVGETGGGKTTVTRLLARLYEIQQGTITLNGTDIRLLPLRGLRSRIAVVLQDPYLFTGTIRYNISLGDPQADLRVEEAARAVGANRFIETLPHGFDEPVRERGANLSAGQRQLISFARAVAFDPEILVLDEATSSVDSESERLIREGLAGLLSGRTSLVVAHRLSTVEDADRIVVVHRGEKAEEGSHQELLAKRGVYWRLYQLQFRE